MTVSTIELYEALISAGVDEAVARSAAKAVLSREEAAERLATKADLERAFKTQNMWKNNGKQHRPREFSQGCLVCRHQSFDSRHPGRNLTVLQDARASAFGTKRTLPVCWT